MAFHDVTLTDEPGASVVPARGIGSYDLAVRTGQSSYTPVRNGVAVFRQRLDRFAFEHSIGIGYLFPAPRA